MNILCAVKSSNRSETIHGVDRVYAVAGMQTLTIPAVLAAFFISNAWHGRCLLMIGVNETTHQFTDARL